MIAVTPGQAGDSPMLQPLLAHLAVKRVGPGRPRTRPEALIGDEAYSSRGTRAVLRSRGVKVGDSVMLPVLLLDLRESQGVTIVLATHDEAVAARSDRIIHLTDGRITSTT